MTCWCAILERGEAINTYVYRKTVIINVDRDTTVSSVFEQVQRDMAATGQRGDRLEAWVLANPVAKPKTKTQAKAIFPTTTVALEDLADIAGIESPLSDLGIPTEDDKTNIPLVIILSTTEDARPPSKDKLPSVDETSSLPTRNQIIDAARRKGKPPSTSAKNSELRATQNIKNLDAVLNHRPLELSPPSITLYHPIFSVFCSLMGRPTADMTFTHDELDRAYSLIEVCMNFYEDESDRHAALRNLNLICPSFCTETGVQVTMSTIRPDGHTSTIAKELSKAPTAFRSFEEIKNGAGSGNADAMDQAEAVFVAVCSSPNYHEICAASCCPAFLIGFQGPYLGVAAGVFADRFISERLTDYIFAGPRRGRGDTSRSPTSVAIREVAKLLNAVQTCLAELELYYSELKRPRVTAQPAPTASASMRSRTLDRIFPFWNKFTSNDQIHALLYTGRLASDHPGKMIFQANMTIQGLQGDPVPVIVKFTNSYCAEAHKLLASQTPPMAPNLYFCEVVKEVGMFVVVMDHITHTSFTALPQGVYDLLASAIKCLHLHNFVFGDLREPNILVTNDGHGLMLVDFDWSGKEGDAKYPADIALNSGILWHEDVKREGIIRKAHDEYLLCALESSVEASG